MKPIGKDATLDELKFILAIIRQMVRFQAHDEALWATKSVHFSDDGREIEFPISAAEAYMQESLRDLHRVIEEGDTEAMRRIEERSITAGII